MFAQLFLCVGGLLSIILGFKEGDYLLSLCGVMVLTSTSLSIFQLKTGKTLSLWSNS